MSQVRVVCVDIDDTLVDYFGRIPQSAVSAIRAARERGHLVLLATGRSYRDIWPEVLDIGFDGVISASGAQVVVAGEVLADNHLSRAQVRQVTQQFEEGVAEYCLHAADGLYVTEGAGRIFQSLLDTKVARGARAAVLHQGPFSYLASMQVAADPMKAPVNKITYVGAAHSVTELSAMFPDLAAVPSAPDSLGHGSGEMVVRGVSKARGLDLVLAHVGASRADSVAVGDGYNDIELLAAAGVGIAVKNAPRRVQWAADLVVDQPCRGGLQQALRATHILA
ncbi:MAG: Cof-type HAD-IIB family hydrolase [Propioniciclava sp.]